MTPFTMCQGLAARGEDKDRAKQLFTQIPRNVRDKLLNIDYRHAEARCPQNLPIGNLIAEAVGKLA